MLAYTFQTVNPRGAIVHAISVPAGHLIEAHTLARRFAMSLVEGGPEGKSWSGWAVEILDPFGRYVLSVPVGAADPVEQPEPVRRRA